MASYVKIQIEHDKYVGLETDLLPPVGTRIVAHKHLYDGGSYPILEVVSHEWRIEDAVADSLKEEAGPKLIVWVKTRIVEE